jgi:hypothetical protein
MHQLDKLILDNLRHEAFNKAGVTKLDDDGKLIGTLNGLDRLVLCQNSLPVW